MLGSIDAGGVVIGGPLHELRCSSLLRSSCVSFSNSDNRLKLMSLMIEMLYRQRTHWRLCSLLNGSEIIQRKPILRHLLQGSFESMAALHRT